MIETNFRSAAVAAIALGAALAAPAFVAPAAARAIYARPVVAQPDIAQPVVAQPVVEDEAAVPPNAMGHFTCAFNELHTRLERKNCGGDHYRYGY